MLEKFQKYKKKLHKLYDFKKILAKIGVLLYYQDISLKDLKMSKSISETRILHLWLEADEDGNKKDKYGNTLFQIEDSNDDSNIKLDVELMARDFLEKQDKDDA